jgi:hypothetical protein
MPDRSFLELACFLLRIIEEEAVMSRRSRRGGIIAVLLFGLLIAVSALIVGSIVIASNVRLRHQDTADGSRVRVETPFGDLNIDARDNLKPASVGVPVYPGAMREHGNEGGVMFDFDARDGGSRQFSVVTAQYSTTDSAERVREFYRAQLPHWIFTQRMGDAMKIEYSEGGYKRIIAIHARGGRTHIGIASLGEPGVN